MQSSSSSSSSSVGLVCGNGIVEPGEACDDGNNDPNDGCDNCQPTGPVCYSPSDCVAGTECSYFSCSPVCETAGQQDCPEICQGVCVPSDDCLGIALAEGVPTIFEIRGVVSENLTQTHTFATKFDLEDSSFIDAEGANTMEALEGIAVDGTCLEEACDITVTTAPTTVWTLQAEERHLAVQVKSLATSDTAVSNQSGITLLRFEARARGNEDLLLTQAVFKAQSGNTANAHNYALWVDTDADRTVDTILQDGILPVDGSVIFSNFPTGGYVLPIEETVVFEVHGDVAAALVEGGLQLKFDDADNNAVMAEVLADGTTLSGIRLNGGVCPADTCDIDLGTTDSTRWILVDHGDLYVTKDSTPLRPRQILAGALSDPLLRLRFHADMEDIDVTDLQISTLDSSPVSVDVLELFHDGETTAFATAGNCGSAQVPTENDGQPIRTFCAVMNSQQLIVPKGGDANVLVRARVKSDAEGGESFDSFTLFVHERALADESTGEGAVHARGRISAENLTANDGDTTAEGEIFLGVSAPMANQRIIGEENIVIGAKTSSISNALGATGTVPSGIANIGGFNFNAFSNTNTKYGLNRVVMTDLIFTVNASNVAMDASGFKIYNMNDSSIAIDCAPYTTKGEEIIGTASGTFLLECVNLDEEGADVEIPSGEMLTLYLQANITNANTAAASGGASILQVSLTNFTDSTKDETGVLPGESHVMWADMDESQASFFYWIEYPDTTVSSITLRG